MLDDERTLQSLLDSGLVSTEDAELIAGFARSRETSVARASIESGLVSERALVARLSEDLAVPSVSLERFEGKPELFAVLPPPFVKRHRALPVGLKERDGELTLFVAMENPYDLDILEALDECCVHPIVPLLAGPLDLDRAIGRVYAVPPAPEPIEYTAPPQRSSDPDQSGMFGGFGAATQADVASALSLLDDIPRNRHSDATPPSGVDIELPPGERSDSMSLSLSQLPLASGRDAGTSQGNPAADARRNAFQRGATSRLGLPWTSRRSDELVRAVTRLLIERGVFTEEELLEALDG
jgi:hypothetical protein